MLFHCIHFMTSDNCNYYHQDWIHLTELVWSFEDVRFKFTVADVAVDSVADAEQFVRIEDDEFRIGHEDFGRLIVLDGQNEGVDGVA